MRIVLENVTKRFGNVTAIDKITLDINDGEMLALFRPLWLRENQQRYLRFAVSTA